MPEGEFAGDPRVAEGFAAVEQSGQKWIANP
jgi:hypothetical protein